MAVRGADRLDRALARMEEDATDRNVHRVAGELILADAKRRTRSRRVASTGKVTATNRGAVVRMGSPAVPWAAPSHFGHNPRAQGGSMKANPFMFDARDAKEDQVVDLFLTRTMKAIRESGL